MALTFPGITFQLRGDVCGLFGENLQYDQFNVRNSAQLSVMPFFKANFLDSVLENLKLSQEPVVMATVEICADKMCSNPF